MFLLFKRITKKYIAGISLFAVYCYPPQQK